MCIVGILHFGYFSFSSPHHTRLSLLCTIQTNTPNNHISTTNWIDGECICHCVNYISSEKQELVVSYFKTVVKCKTSSKLYDYYEIPIYIYGRWSMKINKCYLCGNALLKKILKYDVFVQPICSQEENIMNKKFNWRKV